ncbi:MAG: hypothetical protein H7338_14200 [Candidatus Sericytochromatia bacterium]|nr:hypothetical protein [Candidatus Sericytochromatia bacterium]
MLLRRALAVAAILAVLPMTAFANQQPLTMKDLGLMLLDRQSGGAAFDAPLRLVARLPKAAPSVNRFRADAGTFFTEYDVLKDAPISYEHVGDRDFNTLFYDAARTSGSVKVSRKLVEKVAFNLVGLAKASAASGELSSAEESLASDPDAAAKAAIAVLQKQKATLGDQQRDSLLRMIVALGGTAIALQEVTKSAPGMLKSGERLGASANPTALQQRFGMDFGAIASIPAIVSGTGQSISALQQVTQDAPALAKNVAVISAGLLSLFE